MKETKRDIAPGTSVSWARDNYPQKLTETLSVKAYVEIDGAQEEIAQCTFTVVLRDGPNTTEVTDECGGVDSVHYEKVNDWSDIGTDKIRIKVTVAKKVGSP